MAVAPPYRETPLTGAWLLPPPPPPLIHIQFGFQDDDEERRWLEQKMEEGEADMGCDWSDGPLAPGGCRW